MKRLLILLFISATAFAQSNLSDFDKSMEFYFRGEYNLAYEGFRSVYGNSELSDELFSASLFYAAQSLLELNQIDAAEVLLEKFTEFHTTSNYRDEALYQLGSLYFSGEKYTQCRRVLLLLIRDYPVSEFSGSSYYLIGESYSAEKRFLDAEYFLKEAISLRDENPYLDYSIYTLANLFEKQNEYENAIAYYDELLTYYRSSELAPFAQLRIGICYFHLGEYESAVLELTNPLISNLEIEQQTEARYVLANSFFKQAEFKNAETTFERILSEIKDKTAKDKIEYGLAWVKFQTGKYRDAFKAFDVLRVTAEGETGEHAFFWSGECRRYEGELTKALRIYKKFINEYPNSALLPAALLNIGLIYFNEGSISEADDYLNRALTFKDAASKAKALNVLGEIYLRQSKFRTARNYFLQVGKLKKLPQNLINRAVLGIGASNFYLKNYEPAIEELSNLSGNYNRFEKQKVSYFLAESYYATGNYESAIRYFSDVDYSTPEIGSEALYGKAYSYFNMKNYPDAAYYFGEFTKQFKNNKNFLNAWLRSGDSFYGTKNFERAAQIYGEIFSMYKNKIGSDFAYFQFAQSLFKSGNGKKAVSIAKQLQRKFPRSRYSDDAQ